MWSFIKRWADESKLGTDKMKKVQLVFLVLFVCTGAAFFVCSCGGGGGSDTITIRNPKINPGEATIFVGQNVTFSVSSGTSPYTWTSSNTTILRYVPEQSPSDGSSAFFQADGGQTGTVTVAVMDHDGKKAEATVTVSRETPRVIPASATIQYPAASTPAMTFTASGGDAPYAWTVDKPGVASISGSASERTVNLTANGIGEVTVTVFDKYNQSASATLTVVSLLPRIVPSRAVIGNTGTIAFTASQGVAPYTWNVGDINVGTLSAFTGESVTFSALNPGNTVVIVTDSAGHSAQATVEVKSITPIISPSEAFLTSGDVVTFQAVGGTLPYQWINSNPSLGTIVILSDATAQFTASADTFGAATITLEDAAGQTGTATVTVIHAFSLSPSSVTATQGDAVNFFIFGGTPPYQAALTNTTAGTVSVSGTTVTVSIAADAPVGSFPGLLEVYDASGNMITAEVIIEAAPAP
jgi:hypothetical protein